MKLFRIKWSEKNILGMSYPLNECGFIVGHPSKEAASKTESNIFTFVPTGKTGGSRWSIHPFYLVMCEK